MAAQLICFPSFSGDFPVSSSRLLVCSLFKESILSQNDSTEELLGTAESLQVEGRSSDMPAKEKRKIFELRVWAKAIGKLLSSSTYASFMGSFTLILFLPGNICKPTKKSSPSSLSVLRGIAGRRLSASSKPFCKTSTTLYVAEAESSAIILIEQSPTLFLLATIVVFQSGIEQ